VLPLFDPRGPDGRYRPLQQRPLFPPEVDTRAAGARRQDTGEELAPARRKRLPRRADLSPPILVYSLRTNPRPARPPQSKVRPVSQPPEDPKDLSPGDLSDHSLGDLSPTSHVPPCPPAPARQRLHRLERLVLALSAALTREQVADVVIAEGLAALGARAGSVALLTDDGRELVTLRCHGYPPDLVTAYARYPLGTSLPNADAARTARPLFVQTRAERDALYPHLAQPGPRGALAALPLVADGRVIGGLALSLSDDRRFSRADRAFMQTIGRAGAQALERGRLFDAAQRELAERRHAEAALRESEARQEAVVAAALDCLITIDADGRVLEWNPAAERTFGYPRAAAVGRLLSELILPPPLREAYARGIARYLATGKGPFLGRRVEVPARRADGTELAVELTAVPVHLGGRVLFTASLRDITEQRQREAERTALLEQVRAAAERQRVLLRDVLTSVTEGKLLLCTSPAQLPPPRAPVGGPIRLTREAGLSALRRRAVEASRAAGHPEGRRQDLMTAASEAGMNAVVHGGEGTAWVSAGADGVVQVRVEDRGAGIAVEDLPRAALARGFSTKATLGHGLKLMIDTADRLYLLTGPGGTAVVIEQGRTAPTPNWL